MKPLQPLMIRLLMIRLQKLDRENMHCVNLFEKGVQQSSGQLQPTRYSCEEAECKGKKKVKRFSALIQF